MTCPVKAMERGKLIFRPYYRVLCLYKEQKSFVTDNKLPSDSFLSLLVCFMVLFNLIHISELIPCMLAVSELQQRCN